MGIVGRCRNHRKKHTDHGLGQGGFALLNSIIGVGLSSILILSAGTLYSNYLAMNLTMETRNQFLEFVSDLHRDLRREPACASMLGGNSVTGTIFSLKAADGTNYLSEGETLSNVKYTRLAVGTPTVANPTSPPNERIFFIDLSVEGEYVNGLYPDRPVGRRGFLVVARATDGDHISACSAKSPLVGGYQGVGAYKESLCALVVSDPATYGALVATNGVPLNGTGGDDILVGTTDDDQIFGNGGNDIICGNGGTDTIDGGDGDDQCVGPNLSNCETDDYITP